MKALIGYSGFVGSNLSEQVEFDDFYNSKNLFEIKNKSYDELYCSAPSAVKWLANKNPAEDLASIFNLIENLEQVQAKKFILLSTVDIYKFLLGVNEDSKISLQNHHAYGSHRRILENYIKERFDEHFIIRLPALFGKGLKKNVIYDFMHNNEVEKIHSEAMFQFYNLENLSEDIKKVIENNIKIINFATEPISVEELAQNVFNLSFKNKTQNEAAFYDIHTKYAKLFNKNGLYIKEKDEIFEELKAFIKKEQK